MATVYLPCDGPPVAIGPVRVEFDDGVAMVRGQVFNEGLSVVSLRPIGRVLFARPTPFLLEGCMLLVR